MHQIPSNFFKLGFSDGIFIELKHSDRLDFRKIAFELNETWQVMPKEAKQNITDRSYMELSRLNSAIFEMYIFRRFCLEMNFDCEIEIADGKEPKTLDFLFINSDIKIAVECTTINENSNNKSFNISQNLNNAIRSTVDKKSMKIGGLNDCPKVLAIGNCFDFLHQSRFSKFNAIYGQVAVQIPDEKVEAKLVLSDEGSWKKWIGLKNGFDAIWFSNGYIPGYANPKGDELWIKPISENIDWIKHLHKDLTFYTGDKTLLCTTANKDYLWSPISIF